MATIEPNFESICINPNDDLVLYKKEIVRSRIEKFLYAICSLDNDDLPTPLTRIEEMYKCLVTGVDFITFTPLSRAEKFVMAMLGVYDVELLPTPISRSETLMKKIATGDNNLDDVDNLQSRYEFLLAYIIKAGGFNGGSPGDSVDFYYKLTSLTSGFTTIYDTYDMPVKNAVLRGDTKLIDELGNECDEPNTPKIYMGAYVNETTGELTESAVSFYTDFLKSPNVNFIVKGNNRYKRIAYYDKDKKYIAGTNSTDKYNGYFRPHQTLTRPENAAYYRLSASLSLAEDATYTPDTKLSIVDQYGETLYPTELVSVEMPVLKTVGKNLFDGELQSGRYTMGEGTPFNDSDAVRTVNKITVKPSTKYTVSVIGNGQLRNISEYNNGNYIGGIERYFPTYTFETSSTTNEIHISFQSKDLNLQVQVEENPEVTTYEPYKSTTVSCNEEVALREIDGVKDELNLVTGELTQRVGEIVFNGSERWTIYNFSAENDNGWNQNCAIFGIDMKDKLNGNSYRCDMFTYTGVDILLANNIEGIYSGGKPTSFFINISKTKASTVAELKNWLSTNNVTLQYLLVEPVVKTVELTTVNQNNEETELSTFYDTTHVITSSEGLVPEGGILTKSPIYYVNYPINSSLTTLYDTVENSVKNAVLRGQTLVNISSLTGVTTLKPADVIFIENPGMKMNTTYTIMFNCSNTPSTNFVEVRTMIDNTQVTQVQQNVSAGYNKFTIKTNASKETNRFRFKNDASATTDFIFSELVILEGDYTNENISYFEGMASVTMPVLKTVGKNLYNKTPFNGFIDSANGKFTYNNSTTRKISDYVEVKPNTMYKVSGCTMTAMWGYDKDKNPVSAINIYTDYITTTNDMRFIAFNINAEVEHSNIQLEEGTVATSYEPHKSTAVSCNEEVELRAVGSNKDELNLVTGELIQRIGTYTFTGNETFKSGGPADSPHYFYLGFAANNITMPSSTVNTPLICNRLPTITYDKFTMDGGGINFTYDLRLNFPDCNCNQGATVTDLQNYLKNNETIIYYPIEAVHKTVDLSIVDQDSIETELKTFDDITHVTVSSEGLVPTGDIDIARPNQFVDYSLDNGLTTLYNTLEYPVKNSVLRGSTLVNLVGTYKHTISTVDKPIVWGQKRLFLTNIKPNTIYTLRAKMTEVVKGNYGPRVQIFFSTYSMGEVNTTTSTSDTLIFTSPAELSSDAHLRLIVTGSEAEATEVDFEILLLEGEHPDIKDIPYFDYMQSVKMPVLKTVGKNLITPFTKWSILSGDSAAYTLTDKRVEVVLSRWNMGVKTTIQLKPNTLYHIAWDEVSKANFNFTGTDKKGDLAPFNSFTTDYTGIVGVSVKNSTTSGTLIIDGLRINEGNTDLGYEPHKSTTVSCNEEVELCGIGDIKDELNLVTGEYTKVIYEYTFTGNEIWELKAGANNGSGYSYFSCNLTGSIPKYNYKSDANIPIYCDKLPVITYNDFDNKLKNVGINLTYFFRLNFSDCDSNNGATVEDLKAYLKANPTTVQYPISSSVKTVELSTLDQDGKETELSTFDDITHVITSSEGLIPTGEITVATKDATDVIDAGVMSLRMDDISNSQRTLEGSANAQSDDIDVTMLGTTDVYEQLL